MDFRHVNQNLIHAGQWGGYPPQTPQPPGPLHTHKTSQCTMQHTDHMIQFYSTPQGVKSTLLPRQVQALAAVSKGK